MDLSNMCKGDAVCVTASATLQQAAALMDDQSIGCLVVIEDRDSRIPIGLITDRDIVTKAVAGGFDINRERVTTAMSGDLVVVRRDASAAEAISLMADRQVRRILLTDERGMVCGVVSADDLMRKLTDDLSSIGRIYASGQTRRARRLRQRDFTRMA